MGIDTNIATAFRFLPKVHPHVASHREQKPVKVEDQIKPNLNGKIALLLTKGVGTMWCAYAFAALALIALPQALGSPLTLIQWISQTFIQLVMLSVIMVGQNLLSAASDKRAEDTWKDADATFHTAGQIQEHLLLQDNHLAAQDVRLEEIIAALTTAFPSVAAQLGQPDGGEPPASR
ncbi:MAG TPA: hypothetical protein VF898_07650 [Chloroflexota bacterium]